MAGTDWLLLFHLLGAFAYVSGLAIAAAAFFAARRLERPSEIAAVLVLARSGVLLVGAGSLLVLAFGIWLAEHAGYGLGAGWVSAALALFVAAAVLGAVGGQAPKRARRLATRLAGEADAPSAELTRQLDDRRALAANAAAALGVVAILVLMVWKPGS